MKQATFQTQKEDHICLLILLGFALVFLLYLAMIAWIVYEFLRSPSEPSTRVIYPAIVIKSLHRTKQVQYVKTKLFPR